MLDAAAPAAGTSPVGLGWNVLSVSVSCGAERGLKDVPVTGSTASGELLRVEFGCGVVADHLADLVLQRVSIRLEVSVTRPTHTVGGQRLISGL